MTEDTISSGSLYYIDSLDIKNMIITIAILNHDEDDMICLKLNLRNCDTIVFNEYRMKYTLQHHYKQLI